jgi:hypothetical protein
MGRAIPERRTHVVTAVPDDTLDYSRAHSNVVEE